MASLVFNVASEDIADQTLDWEGATNLRVLLLTGAGTPIKANATVTAALAETNVDESTATNYVRKTLANMTVSQSSTSTIFDADDVTWTSLGGASNDTITGALIYYGTTDSGDDATNIPIAYIDFGASDLTTNGSNVTLAGHATNGFFYLDNS